MPTRYKHGIAVCYACDETQIGQCPICFTGLCWNHASKNSVSPWMCPSCKAEMFRAVYQETAEWLKQQRWYLVADLRGQNNGIRIYGKSDEILYDLLADLTIEEQTHG